LTDRPAGPRVRLRRARGGRFLLVALCAIAALAPLAAHAQNYFEVSPQTLAPRALMPPLAPPLPATRNGAAAQRVIVRAIRALVFVPGVGAVVKTGRNAEGVEVDRLPLLDDDAFRARIAPFIGEPLTLARLNEITRAVILHYRDRDRPLVDVVVPEQDVDNGVVQLAVVEFKLGRVRVEGNEWFASDVLAQEVSLKPGDAIVGSRLMIDQTVLNANPIRQVDLLYERGAQAGSTDLVVKTTDRLPLSAHAGFDDGGPPTLGPDRYNVGFTWGNVFGLDHQFSYQFTASSDILSGNPSLPGRPDAPRFEAHSFNYTLPLPWSDQLTIFGLYARAVPRLDNGLDQLGLTGQASLRYTIRLPPTARFIQELQLGYDFKTTNNNLSFGGTLVTPTVSEIDQAVAQYTATLKDDYGSTTATGLLYAAPGGISGANNDAAFATQRQGAPDRYVYGQLTVERLTPLPELGPVPAGLIWSIKGTLQQTTAPLLASEELALGGVGSVRGYDPYAVIGDEGFLLSNELRLPAFSATGLVRDEPWLDRLQPFVFSDVGHVASLVAQAGEPSNATLASAGAGLNYTIGRYLAFYADFGWQLLRVPGGPQHAGGRGDVSLTLGF
jgi:hemolysin activation/secretion protein